jgi:hypothetical protein
MRSEIAILRQKTADLKARNELRHHSFASKTFDSKARDELRTSDNPVFRLKNANIQKIPQKTPRKSRQQCPEKLGDETNLLDVSIMITISISYLYMLSIIYMLVT